MTKTVYILRHAKSPMIGGDDFERPLSDEGFADMQKLGEKMSAMSLAPDFCHCSPARRTRQTLKTIMESGVGAVETDFPDKQYNASAGTLYDILKLTDPHHGSVMIIAHNPGIHSFANFLAKKESAPPELSMGYQAGTLTVIEFDGDHWGRVLPDSGTVRHFLVPGRY